MAEHLKIAWWQWLPFRPWRIVGAVESADLVPDLLPRNGAVLVGTLEQPKWIALDCPCRQGHRILLNADARRQPAWRIAAARDGKLSIAPSVDYSDRQRRCHYFVRNGKILWAKDSTR